MPSVEIADCQALRAELMRLNPARVVDDNPEADALAEIDDDVGLAVAVEIAEDPDSLS